MTSLSFMVEKTGALPGKTQPHPEVFEAFSLATSRTCTNGWLVRGERQLAVSGDTLDHSAIRAGPRMHIGQFYRIEEVYALFVPFSHWLRLAYLGGLGIEC